MKCWGCKSKLKEAGWFFVDAPKPLALCDPCHQDSAPSAHRREWRTIGPVGSVSTRLPIGTLGGGDGLVRRKGLSP